MSSNEDEFNDAETSAGAFQKKRRIQRACDICRRKKIRCDGVQMPGNKCSNCIAYSFDCTYIETAKKRGPPKGYVETLENRVERLEKLLRRLCPDEDSYKKLTESLDSNWMADRPPAESSEVVGSSLTSLGCTPSQEPGINTTVGIDYVTKSIRHAANEPIPPIPPPDVEEETTLILADNLKRLELEPNDFRFFGKSSGAMLVHTALELKNEYTGRGDFMDIVELHKKRKMMKNLRNEFWTARPWETDHGLIEGPKYTFPEPDLSKHLVDLYFDCVNIYLPLLHRPTFEKWVNEGLHLSDDKFAPVYLLVLAVGARYSSDPRAMLDGVDSYHSCGWKWFDQVQMMKRSMLSPPTLFDIQSYCLAVQFLQGSSAPQSCWTLVGIGIRLAQDVGAHRRKIHSHKMTAEDEMWKRAFWVLVCVDRMVSSSLGRPCAIQDEDFDLDLPVDCDDEYWDNPDPEQRFKQPPGKPSTVTFFILYLKLHQILAFSLRTIYSINKSKVLLGFVGSQWEQHIVAELDSALNKWVDTVPDHLRWDPNREDDQCFAQSVALYSAYYHIQILIHRPFIPSPSKPSPLSFPSLAICTNAARSCCHVVDIQQKRIALPGKVKPPHMMATPQIQMSVFTSGIVLLLSIWGGKRSGLSTDPNREMAEVHKCMNVLRDGEQRWHSAGRLWDILYELASVGDLPLPQYSPPPTNKRERDADTPRSSSSAGPSPQMVPENIPRNIAGSRRVNKESSERAAALRHGGSGDRIASCDQPSQSVERRPSRPQIKHEVAPTPPPHVPVQYYSLPVYSNELGRLPLHGQVAFSSDPSVHPIHGGPQQGAGYWSSQPQQPSLGSSNVASGSGSGMRLNSGPPAGIDGTGGVGYPSLGEMSSMTTGFEMDAAAMAAGMMLDTMAGTLSYGQHMSQPNPPPGMGYGLVGMEGSGAGSMDGYRGLAMDTTGMGAMSNDASRSMNRGGPSGQQLGHAGLQVPEQQQDMSYQFVDNDTIAMWSTAPTGFELDEWGTYLTNVSELTQHSHQPGGTGNAGGNIMHQSHLT